MLFSILELIRSLTFFTTSYSNNVFPEPLSKEEEEKYITLLLNKDPKARDKLIEHNLRLVAHIVKKYENSNIDTDDLISIGTIGLIKGIDSYSLKHGTKITTYCARCIENEILMYFRSNKKNNMVVSLDEPIGFDKDGNEVTILEVLKTPLMLTSIILLHSSDVYWTSGVLEDTPALLTRISIFPYLCAKLPTTFSTSCKSAKFVT